MVVGGLGTVGRCCSSSSDGQHPQPLVEACHSRSLKENEAKGANATLIIKKEIALFLGPTMIIIERFDQKKCRWSPKWPLLCIFVVHVIGTRWFVARSGL